MNSTPVEATLPSGTKLVVPSSWTESDLAELDKPLNLLDDPPPESGRAQQVRRLEQLGLHKAASAVKVCYRRGKKSDYKCGRSFKTVLLSHLRFCCKSCDGVIAKRLFREHRAYREMLHPRGTLYRVTIKSDHYSLTPQGIRSFEEATVQGMRQWLEDCEGWGFKSLTHPDSGQLVAKGILYLPPSVSMPLAGLAVQFAACTLGVAASVHAYEEMLLDILLPTISEGHGVLRADLMAAFHGGNHLRSLGIFYGLIGKKRREELERQKLHLTSTEESGAGFCESQKGAVRPGPPCPHCGPTCQRIAVSYEPLEILDNVPLLEEPHSDVFWSQMWARLRIRRFFEPQVTP